MAGNDNEKLKRGVSLPPDVGTDDFAGDIHGRNSLQADDQGNVRNQRQAVPGVKRTTEGVVESFEKTEEQARDKREAAERRNRPSGSEKK